MEQDLPILVKSLLSENSFVANTGYSSGYVCLSDDEKRILHSLRKRLSDLYQKKEFTIVYRGQNRQELKKRLFRKWERFADDILYARLFFFGDKAKHYFKQSRPSLEKRGYLECIDDVSLGTFQFIFERIRKILTNSGTDLSSGAVERLSNFTQANSEFTDFFIRDNCENFVNLTFNSEKSHWEYIRDYYLYLLHTFDKYGLAESSVFVSTTTEVRVARRFSNDDGIILIYLVPHPLNKYGVDISTVREFNANYRDKGFPIYSQTAYPDQNEVSIKGALFPHFILGINDFQYDRFVLNPHIFETSSLLDFVHKYGLQIDQKNFAELIKSTGYAGHVSRKWNHIYTDCFHR